VWLDAKAPDGFTVHSFADDDPIKCRDYVRQKAGLPGFEPKRGNNNFASPADVQHSLMAALAAQKQEHPPKGRITKIYDYTDANGAVLYQVCRFEPKSFRHRRPNGNGGWIWEAGERRVLYRLPDILKYPSATVFITEGEKDADRIAGLGHCATTVASGKWTADCASPLAGRDVLILEDNDDAGRKRALEAAEVLHGTAKTIRIVRLPDLPDKGDISDWLDADLRNAEKLVDICLDVLLWQPEAKTEAAQEPATAPGTLNSSSETSDGAAARTRTAKGVSLADFHAYMPMHNYIFAPSREPWPANSVNARVPPVPVVDANGVPVLDKEGKQKTIRASAWLDRYQAVEQMTWSPGEPMLIRNRLISEGGWIERNGVTCFNLYRQPTIEHGDATQAGPWLDRVRTARLQKCQ
jgi:hypothetical protein